MNTNNEQCDDGKYENRYLCVWCARHVRDSLCRRSIRHSNCHRAQKCCRNQKSSLQCILKCRKVDLSMHTHAFTFTHRRRGREGREKREQHEQMERKEENENVCNFINIKTEKRKAIFSRLFPQLS